MIWIAAIVIGAIFLVGGAFRLNENKKRGGDTRIYALITYIGFALVVVCTLRTISPYLTFLPEEYETIIILGIDVAALMAGGEWFLKPEFESGKKKDNHLSEYRDRQNSYRPKNKKKKK